MQELNVTVITNVCLEVDIEPEAFDLVIAAHKNEDNEGEHLLDAIVNAGGSVTSEVQVHETLLYDPEHLLGQQVEFDEPFGKVAQGFIIGWDNANDDNFFVAYNLGGLPLPLKAAHVAAGTFERRQLRYRETGAKL
jgi:hypothetical protein